MRKEEEGKIGNFRGESWIIFPFCQLFFALGDTYARMVIFGAVIVPTVTLQEKDHPNFLKLRRYHAILFLKAFVFFIHSSGC